MSAMTDAVFDPQALATVPDGQPAPAVALPPPRVVERFAFTGEAREYFRIWIVNLFLSIVTLGVYSAWAKVRKKRYFYGNSWVAGSNFEYHGNPVAILKGRLIAFTAFMAYTLAGGFSPRGSAYVLLALSPLVPWFVVRSMSFNAANSSYRNLRLHFDGRYREALKALAPFILLPIAALLAPEPDITSRDPSGMWPYFVAPLILAAFYPYVVGSLKLLHVSRSRYGESAFACAARIKDFYGVYILAFVLMVGLGAAFSFAVMLVVMMLPDWGWSGIPALYLVSGAIVLGFTQARVMNLTLSATSLGGGGVRLRSTMSSLRLAMIYVQNLLAITMTLGLAIPWAAVRIARYRMECLAL